MLESDCDVTAVASDGAMIAIMQHDDVAMRLIGAGGMSESFDQTLRRLRFPIPANLRPHHHAAHSRALDLFV
jgi:hypothetical protein